LRLRILQRARRRPPAWPRPPAHNPSARAPSQTSPGADPMVGRQVTGQGPTRLAHWALVPPLTADPLPGPPCAIDNVAQGGRVVLETPSWNGRVGAGRLGGRSRHLRQLRLL
jgi:hypothetical protein